MSAMSRRPALLTAGTAALGGFLVGYDTAVVNGTVEAAALAFLFVLRAVRETKGRELEER